MFEAAMIKFSGECSQTILNVPKAFPSGQLSETHHIEMIPAGEIPNAIIAFVASNTFVEFVFWEHSHQLSKNGFSSIHSLVFFDLALKVQIQIVETKKTI